jgi:hypothetical protein
MARPDASTDVCAANPFDNVAAFCTLPIMSRAQRFVLAILPLLIAVVSMLAVALDKKGIGRLLFSEQGPIELGTAALFVFAGVVAAGIALRSQDGVPRFYRGLLVCFALAAFLVALEEISWGQHLFGWTSPSWFGTHNKQAELNLHNLADSKPSNWLRSVAYVVFPAGFLVLPLIAAALPGTYRPGHWTYYLLPRLELTTLVLLSCVITVPNDLPKALVGDYRMGGELRELTELYQAWAAAAYVLILRRRFSALPSRAPAALAGARAPG